MPESQVNIMEKAMRMRRHLSVIILNWNAAADTIRCAQAVLQWQNINPSVLIVDNASQEDDIKRIKHACPTLQVICNSANRGFAGGNNQGITAALDIIDAPVLLLNNDAVIKENDVEKILETLTIAPNIGFVGPLLFEANDKKHLLSAGGRNPVLHHHSHIMNLKPGPRVRSVDYVPGTAVVIRPEVFEEVGLLDEDYFFTMEIADLCKRAYQKGYRSVIDTQSKAFHALDRSQTLRHTLHAYYIIRNRFLFIRKFYPSRKIPLLSVWTLYSWALVLKMYLVKSCESAHAIQLGLQDGLTGRFNRQNERLTRFLDNHCRS